jgi:hypothetical protein
MSSTRRYSRTRAVARNSGSSSTYSLKMVLSGTLTMVWPTRANPCASSAWTIGQVSWNPLTYVPGDSAGRPSSKVPRTPRKPLPREKTVSARATYSSE